MTTSSVAGAGPMRLVLVLATLSSAPAPAGATDAELQAALRRANCGAPAIKELLRRGDLAVYEANCFRTSHRMITVTCDKNRCHVDEPEPENEDAR